MHLEFLRFNLHSCQPATKHLSQCFTWIFHSSTFCPLEHSPPAASLYWDPLNKDIRWKPNIIYSLPTCTIHLCSFQIEGYNAGPKPDVEITNQLQLSKGSTYRLKGKGGMQWSQKAKHMQTQCRSNDSIFGPPPCPCSHDDLRWCYVFQTPWRLICAMTRRQGGLSWSSLNIFR